MFLVQSGGYRMTRGKVAGVCLVGVGQREGCTNLVLKSKATFIIHAHMKVRINRWPTVTTKCGHKYILILPGT